MSVSLCVIAIKLFKRNKMHSHNKNLIHSSHASMSTVRPTICYLYIPKKNKISTQQESQRKIFSNRKVDGKLSFSGETMAIHKHTYELKHFDQCT